MPKILSVSDLTVRDWLSRMDKDAKAARDEKIRDLWLACSSQQEIADAVGMKRETLATEKGFVEIGRFANLNKTQQSSADHATDFKPPIYNIWKQQKKSGELSHFGNSEVGFGGQSALPLHETQAAHHYASKYAEYGEAAVELSVISIQAGRRLGELLKGMPGLGKKGGDRKSKVTVTLDSLGVTANQSKRWQRIAKIKKSQFESYIKKCRKKKKHCTMAAVYKLAPMEVKHDPVRVEETGNRGYLPNMATIRIKPTMATMQNMKTFNPWFSTHSSLGEPEFGVGFETGRTHFSN